MNYNNINLFNTLCIALSSRVQRVSCTSVRHLLTSYTTRVRVIHHMFCAKLLYNIAYFYLYVINSQCILIDHLNFLIKSVTIGIYNYLFSLGTTFNMGYTLASLNPCKSLCNLIMLISVKAYILGCLTDLGCSARVSMKAVFNPCKRD